MKPAATTDKQIQIKTRADFEEIFKTHYSILCSYAHGFLRDPDAAEEVVQEVMFRVWTGRESLIIENSIRSYLFRAVRNGCLNVIKHREKKEEYRSFKKSEHVEIQRSQEDEVIISELEFRIREAIDHLPVERRKIFIMSRYENLTYGQIAVKLGLSIKTIENQMGKALKSLREELSDYLPWLVLFFAKLF